MIRKSNYSLCITWTEVTAYSYRRNADFTSYICILTMSVPRGRPKGMYFGNEYGLYNEIDEHVTYLEAAVSPPRMLANAARSSSGSATSSVPSISEPPSPCKVICKLDDKFAPTACRSFTPNKKSSVGSTACTSIGGIRIVQDDYGEDAEYRVKIRIGNSEFTAWRRYSDFHDLGEAFEEFCGHGLNIRRSRRLEKTLIAWNMVKVHRPWLLQNLQLQFLRKESVLLESFLSHLLFESPNIDLLLEFVH